MTSLMIEVVRWLVKKGADLFAQDEGNLISKDYSER